MVLSTHDLNLAAALCRHLILLRDGRVIAQGPTDEVLTPDAVRALYGVDADVQRHPIAGHLTVTPLARVHVMPPIRTRLAVTLAGFGLLAARRAARRAAGRIDAHLAGPRLRSIDCRSPTTPTRRSSSSRGCRACSRRRSSARRWRRPASSFRRCCATRWPRRTRSASPAARRSARCWRSPFISTSRSPASRRSRSPASPARSARSASSTRWRRRGGAGSRPSCCCWPA